jgi:hypothetical protein
VQLLARPNDAARVRRDPEVMQMLEVHDLSVDYAMLRFYRSVSIENTHFTLSRVQVD